MQKKAAHRRAAALIRHLNEAGIHAELRKSDRFLVGGREYERKLLVGDDEVAIDRFVADHLPNRLMAAVERATADVEGVKRSPTSRGVALHRPGEVLALVTATHASLPGKRLPIAGNFLSAERGPHWSRLRAALQPRPAPGRTSADEPQSIERSEDSVVHEAFPTHVDPATLAVAASSAVRIRTQRALAFAGSVRLLTPEDSITFEPITHRGPMELPFQFSTGGVSVSAALRLRAPGDVLALRVGVEVAHSMVTFAWLRALEGFAELTCVSAPTRTSQPRESSRPGASARPAKNTDRRGSLRGRRAPTASTTEWWPETLHPTATTRRTLAAWVVGHRRRLTRDQRASARAKRNAERVGIALGAGETWVEPHVRGRDPDRPLEFRWAPIALR